LKHLQLCQLQSHIYSPQDFCPCPCLVLISKMK
jgi:hypothetical protein